VVELQRRLRDRELSAVELTRACLQRIERLDGTLHSFVRLNPRAEQEAAEADRRLLSGRGGPLTGLPVAVKDNIHCAAIETSCASRILDGFVPDRDATATARLRQAGVVILGKTNMDEFAMGSSTETSCHGATRNPWAVDRVAGGSSGGSAAAVAAGLAPLALGSDTGGSVRQPAAFCGVVGLKPTYGRVSRSGLVAYGSSLDQIGAFSREVAGAAELLARMAGADGEDATCSPRPTGEFVAACDRGVAGLRVGLPREYFGSGLDGAVDRAVRAAAAELQRQGAAIQDVSLPLTRYAIPTYYLVATAEASSNLARFDGVRYGQRAPSIGDWQDLYRSTRGRGFGEEVWRRIMLGTYALSAGYYDQFYGKAQRVRELLRREFSNLFAGGIHLLLTPAAPTGAFRLGEKTGDPLSMYLSDIYTATVNLAGLPAISVPVGIDGDGLPIGGQLIAPAFGEELLFSGASVIERAFRLAPPSWLQE
jgi:aspartyl-tRNA(Asn)/glutamyl-tRNA(Gln) amidotransferase subunit A